MSKYVLYGFPSCPYCRKVYRFMEKSGIHIPQKNTDDPGIWEELASIGGMEQVPCLVIDGKALYESDDIIAYMREHMLPGKSDS